MANECFIEIIRKGGGRCRIRADFITALIEMEVKNGNEGKFVKVVQIHTGANSFIHCQNDSLDDIWNKINQAMGRRMTCVNSVSSDYPGHPEYAG